MSSFFDSDKQNDSLIGELFGDKRKKPKSSFDDMLSSLSKNKPTVSFNLDDNEPFKKTPVNRPITTVPVNTGTARSNPDSIDDLFSTKLTSSVSKGELRNPLQPKSAPSQRNEDIFGNSNQTKRPTSQPTNSSTRLNVNPSNDFENDRTEELELQIVQLKKDLSSQKYDAQTAIDDRDELKEKLVQSEKKHAKQIRELTENYELEIEKLKIAHQNELKNKLEALERDTKLNMKNQIDTENFTDIKQQLEMTYDTIDHLKKELSNVNETLRIQQETSRKLLNDHLSLQESRSADEYKKRTEEKEAIEDIHKSLKYLYENQSHELHLEKEQLAKNKEKFKLEVEIFQTSKLAILNQIEEKRDELESLKGQFLTKQHDLLTRVLNERRFIEEENRKFQLEKSYDISRIRNEAESLEKYATQVENARIALDNSRISYEDKHNKLNEIEKILMTEIVKLEKYKYAHNQEVSSSFDEL